MGNHIGSLLGLFLTLGSVALSAQAPYIHFIKPAERTFVFGADKTATTSPYDVGRPFSKGPTFLKSPDLSGGWFLTGGGSLVRGWATSIDAIRLDRISSGSRVSRVSIE